MLEAEADSYVEFPDPSDVPPLRPPDPGPFGAGPDILIGWWDIAIGWEGLLRFAPPHGLVPDELVHAELRLNVLKASSHCLVVRGPCTTLLALQPALQAWNEATVTGATRPDAGRVDVEAVVTAGQARLDVTEAARAWLAGERQYGWVLRSATVTDGAVLFRDIILSSRETLNGPKLALYDRSTGHPTATMPPPPSPTSEAGALSFLPLAGR